MSDSAMTSGQAPNGGKQAKSAGMGFIMVAVLIDMISIGLIIPVLPPLVGTFTANQSDHAFWYGAVALAFGIANFVGSPILGALSDRFGRRPVMLIGFSGLALSFFVTAMATALWMLIAVRLVSGAMQANASVANAYVADISTPEERAKRFGMLGAAFGMGFILGPVMGGILGDINLHLPFYVAGSMAVINWCYGYFVLPESLKPENRRAFDWRKANPLSALKKLSNLKGVGPLVFVIALSGLAQLVLQTSWVLYTSFKFGWGPKENGWSLFAVGVMSVLVQGFLLPKLLKIFSPQRLVLMGLLSSVLTNFVWGAATAGWMMYAIIGFNVLGFAVSAAIQSLISNAADANNQGETMGAVSSLNSMMAVTAPVIGAGLLGLVSHLPKGDWRIGAPFYFCAALQAVSLLFAWAHFSRSKAAAAASAVV
ncbi:DHA1 family tetracycline resistance protein-like MFS transporter [Paucibacter oligotrophus]|uniref:DHA1 family tetracycline resistance protein-like MFS transporter n=1 Tax=Roseateles oligotrophus TaxID=1769250 RepID=A0A840L967_9BURK|nr:DHA1 family tetracycline resistance protein-like MFS transporter [Roseateles oligotrophus]